MLSVPSDQDRVEADLQAGRLHCPRCSVGVLGPWGHGRLRNLRLRENGECRFRPRRAICRRRSCRSTHVLLVDCSLYRRRDHVECIGEALLARAAGKSRDQIAATLGRHPDTVRGWLRSFSRKAEAIRAHFTAWAAALDPLLGEIAVTGNACSDALQAIGHAVRAHVQRFGPAAVWQVVAQMSGAVLLCNTSVPYPPVP